MRQYLMTPLLLFSVSEKSAKGHIESMIPYTHRNSVETIKFQHICGADAITQYRRWHEIHAEIFQIWVMNLRYNIIHVDY